MTWWFRMEFHGCGVLIQKDTYHTTFSTMYQLLPLSARVQFIQNHQIGYRSLQNEPRLNFPKRGFWRRPRTHAAVLIKASCRVSPRLTDLSMKVFRLAVVYLLAIIRLSLGHIGYAVDSMVVPAARYYSNVCVWWEMGELIELSVRWLAIGLG